MSARNESQVPYITIALLEIGLNIFTMCAYRVQHIHIARFLEYSGEVNVKLPFYGLYGVQDSTYEPNVGANEAPWVCSIGSAASRQI